MKLNRHIKKFFFLSFWLGMAACIMVLLVAAMNTQKLKTCKGYFISLKGESQNWFLDKKDIAALLIAQGGIRGQELKSFDLRKLENQLKNNVWVKDAELFFDNKQILQIRIEERTPIARVITLNGNSFYIDSSGERLPLSDKYTARLPVFTSFPSEKDKVNKTDSALTRQMIQISEYLAKDQFWMAQIAQIDIQPDRTFDMIPVVGNHTILFGDGNEYDKKFRRLLLFYQQVLSKTGMDVYDQLNVAYDRQVIGVRK
jgi:cell division protein FtsQ